MKTVAIILMMMVFSPISACTDSDVENTRLKIEDKPFLTQDPTTLESLSDDEFLERIHTIILDVVWLSKTKIVLRTRWF